MSDLFRFFDKANRGDFSYVDEVMTDEDIKKISPYVLTMWNAVDNPEIHTILTDRYLNGVVFSLSKHPKLLLKLFIEANGEIDSTKYKFRKSVSKNESKIIRLIAKHYSVGYDDAKDYYDILDEDSIKEIKEIYSYDKDI